MPISYSLGWWRGRSCLGTARRAKLGAGYLVDARERAALPVAGPPAQQTAGSVRFIRLRISLGQSTVLITTCFTRASTKAGPARALRSRPICQRIPLMAATVRAAGIPIGDVPTGPQI